MANIELSEKSREHMIYRAKNVLNARIKIPTIISIISLKFLGTNHLVIGDLPKAR